MGSRRRRKLLAEGAIGDIKYYPYHGILTALDDLSTGHIGALIKLFPVIKRDGPSNAKRDRSMSDDERPAEVLRGERFAML